ncbi:unnamed protein product [Amoebophrya sp. A120]|nr:unnamed protein product [Amoebophrya sp. A120]|eukprot:GSA120T00004849001.1
MSSVASSSTPIPASEVLVTLGGYDGQVSGYDVEQQKFVFGYTTHLGSVRDMHAYGKILVSASSDDTCKVFDLQLKKDIGTLLAHEGSVNKVLVLKSHIITGGEDGKICFWRRGDLELLLKVQTKGVVSLACDREEKILVSAHSDNKVRMWDMKDGKPVWHLGLDLPLTDVCFDKEHLALLPRDGRNVQIVHAPTSAVDSITTDAFEKRVTAICFNKDGLLLGDAEGAVRLVRLGEDNKVVPGGTTANAEEADKETTANLEDSDLDEEEDLEEELVEESEDMLDDEFPSANTTTAANNASTSAGSTSVSSKGSKEKNQQLRPASGSRVRFLSALGDLVAVALASGEVEIYNTADGDFVKLTSFEVPFRCTSMALSFVDNEQLKSQVQQAGRKDDSALLAAEQSDSSEDADEQSEGAAGNKKRVTFDDASDEDDDDDSENAGGDEGKTQATQKNTAAPATATTKPKKKRGRRAGQAAKERELQEIEQLALKNINKERQKAKHLKTSKKAMDKLSQKKVEHERLIKKQVQQADKKRLLEHKQKEQEKAKKKKDAKDARKKEREKKKEQQQEKENRAKLEQKRNGDSGAPAGPKKSKGGKKGGVKKTMKKGKKPGR